MLRLSPWCGVGVDEIRGKWRGAVSRAVVLVSYEQGKYHQDNSKNNESTGTKKLRTYARR